MNFSVISTSKDSELQNSPAKNKPQLTCFETSKSRSIKDHCENWGYDSWEVVTLHDNS
jgi:hypothetical protein